MKSDVVALCMKDALPATKPDETPAINLNDCVLALSRVSDVNDPVLLLLAVVAIKPEYVSVGVDRIVTGSIYGPSSWVDPEH